MNGMGWNSMPLLNRYKPINIPEKFNRPIQQVRFPEGYEDLYLECYDTDLVRDLIDFWGLLYVEPKKDRELKYVADFRKDDFKNEEHFQNAVKKAVRQEARQPFFNELFTWPLKEMSANVRWVAESLVQTGYARLVL